MRAHIVRALAGAAVLALALTACGSTATSPSAGSAHRFGTGEIGDLTLTQGWVTEVDARSPAPSSGGSGAMTMDMAGTSAAYFTIHNDGGKADQLVAARSSAAGQVQLHGTTASADGSSGTMTDVATIAVPADGTATLKPGGYHLMLVDPVRSLAAGDHVRMTLTFRSGTVMTVSLPVLDREDRPES